MDNREYLLFLIPLFFLLISITMMLLGSTEQYFLICVKLTEVLSICE